MKSSLLLALLFCCLGAFAQSPGWSINPYEDRYFVENIGQFEPLAGNPVVAGVDNLGTEIFYSSSGFMYRVRKPVVMPSFLVADEAEEEEERPDNEVEDHTRRVYDTRAISAHWLGAGSPDVRLEAVQTPVFHYAKNGTQLVGAKGYGKLVYRNLYEKIDVDYAFHSTEGMKYNITVRPGGDVSQLALRYEGMQQCFLDNGGNLHVALDDAALIDHAPKAYLLESGTVVPIRFDLSGATLRFHVEQYDHAQTLIIDPWIINPGFTTDTKVFDVGWDCSSNVYAFGGSGPWKVKKFNSAGVLQYNYNTSHTSWYGDLISDDLGNVYITEGCCNGNRQKLNSAGVVQWTQNNGTYEFWRLVYSCDWSKLTMANAYSSGGIAPTNSLNTINMTTGATSAQVAISGSEPRSIAVTAAGNYYVLTSVGNELLARNSTYGPIYNVSNGYTLLYNGPLYSNGSNTTQGQNGIAVYSTFIFTSNGATLMKRNMATGALIASVPIPGGSAEQFSGVAVDNCGNVFVGSNANVYHYDVNLNAVATIPVTGAVYDVAVSGTAQLLVSGNGFLSSQTAPCVVGCPTCIILPAGFSDWEVEVNEAQQVELQWSVQQPDGAATFMVEKSADATHFVAWESLAADRTAYTLVDAAPFKGYSWYRISYRDQAGTLTYGPVRQVWVGEAETSLTVFPNPAHDEIQVRWPKAIEVAGALQVFNAQGNLVMQQSVNQTDLTDGYSLDISTLTDGIYTLGFSGSEYAPVKFVKVTKQD